MTRAWVVWCALWVGACTSQHDIGSACERGICLTTAPETRLPCLIATGTATIQGTPTALDAMCVTDPVHMDDDGMAPCRMLFSAGDSDRTCASLGLEPALDITEVGASICEIPQLQADSRDTLEVTATGWYIEDPLPPADACAPIASQHARLNGPLPINGMTWLVCVEAFADEASISDALRTDEDVQRVDPDSCDILPALPAETPDDIGSLCSPRFEPPQGFFTSRTYVDASSGQCKAGVCLVDATRSAQPWPCPDGDQRCRDAGAPNLDNLSYCSCRCDANGDDSRVACRCPSGYACTDVVSGEAPVVLAGGYCTRVF
jgi:hypothetical protein